MDGPSRRDRGGCIVQCGDPGRPADRTGERSSTGASRHGFRYGEAARHLETLAVAGDIAAGGLRADTNGTLEPGVIEAAAQLAYALLPAGAPPVMLASVRSLTRTSGGVPAMAWLQRTSATPEGGLRANLGINDKDGLRAVLLEGASSRRCQLARRWSWVIVWHEAPQPVAMEPNAPPIVWQAPDGTASELCAALLERMRTIKATVCGS